MGRLTIVLLVRLASAAYTQETEEVYQTFSCRLVIKVDDFEAASERAKTALPIARGTLMNIFSSRTEDDLDEIFLEYAVQAGFAEELIGALTSLGEVIVEGSSLTDVTKRIEKLREDVDRLTEGVRELEEQADRPGLSIDERITIQRNLSRENGELERANNTLARLLNDTAIHPVEVTLVEGHIDDLTAIEHVLFIIVLPGIALLVAAFFLGRLVGGRRGGKDA